MGDTQHGTAPVTTDAGSETPLSDDHADVSIVSSETVFTGKVWNIRRDVFDYSGSQITREYMDHTGAVAVLALDDEDRVLLIKQYRHPVRVREWEIPAGLLDVEGEDPLVAAQRELAEEADLEASEWHLLSEFASSPGGSDEVIRVYLARGVRATEEAFERTEEEADIEVRWVPLAEVVDAVLAHRVQNPSLTIGVLTLLAVKERGLDTLADAQTPWTRHPKLAGAGASAGASAVNAERDDR
ncbi:NUDIX domain-containing protein [Okibacterium fritillariae]|uniref:NUDIX domain-containing protein n=1 Tax=Okibacterium fritillariae TaxID=123320 RepID=UPI0040559100